MKLVKVREKEINVTENWNEISLDGYVKLLQLFEEKEKGELIEEIFLIKFISILTGIEEEFYYNLYDNEIEEISKIIEDFNKIEFKTKDEKKFILNDKVYSYVTPQKLTMGENISIKLLEKKSKNQYESWLNILSILIRPAKEVTDEFNETILVCDDFDGNIDTLIRRKELIKSIPGVNALYIIEAFTLGRV
jgi:hypothetical protein